MNKPKLPRILLLEIDDYMYDLMEKIMSFEDDMKFSLTRVKYAEDALELYEKDGNFDAIAFDYNGLYWWAYQSYDMAEKIRKSNPNIPIIASVCCGLCFPSELRREINLYEIRDGGSSISLEDLTKALEACGVISA